MNTRNVCKPGSLLKPSLHSDPHARVMGVLVRAPRCPCCVACGANCPPLAFVPPLTLWFHLPRVTAQFAVVRDLGREQGRGRVCSVSLPWTSDTQPESLAETGRGPGCRCRADGHSGGDRGTAKPRAALWLPSVLVTWVCAVGTALTWLLSFSERMLSCRSYMESSDVMGNTFKILHGNQFLPIIRYQTVMAIQDGVEQRLSRCAEAQNGTSHAPFLRRCEGHTSAE